ncbi:MAG: hypothetical protein U0787_07770 [Polyangia bacterium]
MADILYCTIKQSRYFDGTSAGLIIGLGCKLVRNRVRLSAHDHAVGKAICGCHGNSPSIFLSRPSSQLETKGESGGSMRSHKKEDIHFCRSAAQKKTAKSATFRREIFSIKVWEPAR